MAARRLVLNGLTAEVAGGVVTGERVDCASPEFYHELELYRQLLALPAASAPRRSRTPDPPPSYVHDCAPRCCRTPAPSARRTSSAPPSVVRQARNARCDGAARRVGIPAGPLPRHRLPGAMPWTLRAMAARRLVLNGLTAEEAGGAATGERLDCASPEFYHELELYRQLLALPAACAPRRSRTPDPPPPDNHEHRTRRCRSPVPRSRRASSAPPPAASHARYLGSFPAGGGEHSARVETVSRRLHLMKEESGHAIPVLVVVALTGVKVCDPEDQSVRMSHALRRISYATCEATRALFAFVAREPRCEPSSQYCHAFETDSPEQAEELNALVGDAFRMAFASQLQPSAPLWSKELSGGSCTRAPDTLPGLTHHYPHCLDRSPSQCDIMGGSKIDPCEASEPSEASEASPSSSEDWNSPTELSCYRRLGERLERMERPPLMKRLALGLSGALLQPSDDDATPLVTDTPTTDPHSSPTNVPLCLNGGYINEASEAEARRERREPRALDKDFRICNNITNGRANTGSAATSSSSGESSCSRASGNNNNNNNANLRPLEPELRHAPWFQQGIPREIALEVLGAQAPGAFLVRGSTTQTGCLALSLRVPGDFAPLGIAHYLILRTPKGYKIKGFTKEFSSLSALVTHHSVMPELLPVALRLPRRALPRRAERESIDALSRPPTLRPQQDV